MRSSEVKATIISVIEGITPDSKASARDTFRHVDNAGRQGLRAPDRVFTMDVVDLPKRADLMTVDALVMQVEITVLYSAARGSEDRVSNDAERIERALLNLAAQHADLYAANILPLDAGETENTIEARFLADVTYRLTGVA